MGCWCGPRRWRTAHVGAFGWVDAGYRGRFVDWVETTLTWSVEVAQHWWTGVRAVWVAAGAEPPTILAGFYVLPRRWAVERTFPGWSDTGA